MLDHQLTKRIFWAIEALLLAGAIGGAALLSQGNEWQPLALVCLVGGLALGAQWFTVTTRSGVFSASMVALVMAMSLLGPAPAVAAGLAAMIVSSGVRRLSVSRWLNNLSTFAFFPFAGALTVRLLAGDVHEAANHTFTKSVTFGLIVFAAFLVTVAVNFVMVALDVRFDEGRSLRRQVTELFLPTLSGQLATGALATILVVAYTNLGLPVLLGSVAVLLIFQQLTVALLRSEDRADQLEARSIQLASLQFGVLATLMDALALRDRRTASHAAAVARYAKALAVEIGSTEEEQEIAHTAGLLHDIGKFTWSDRVLHPEQLTDEDLAVIHRHPQDGATLVGKLDGYGAVADAILYHHERIDGGGYPAGLIGNEIPLASRIVAICSTYDTMTARETYRAPMPPRDAMAELRKAAGGQLDSELVESFIAMLERDGVDLGGEEVSFEAELAFEQRVRKMAQPAAR
ncbi:MAG TPA: HD domain-containing phosphohydrolase [Solirubrobacteraceae bacterium]|jgi:putative nucleotidyltransferase with HDIG domain